MLWFESAWVKSWSVPTQVKANEQFFSLFSSVMPNNVALVFDAVDNYIDFNCIDSNEVIYATHYSSGENGRRVTQNLQTERCVIVRRRRVTIQVNKIFVGTSPQFERKNSMSHLVFWWSISQFIFQLSAIFLHPSSKILVSFFHSCRPLTYAVTMVTWLSDECFSLM